MTKLQDFLNSKVVDVTPMRGRPKAGDLFGVELECEGKAVDWDGGDAVINDWEVHQDGSLRNNHGQACEWVFKGPAPYGKSVERVNALFDYFDRRRAKLVCSNRTSTHVHFNMSDKRAYQVVNTFILFTILEDILDRYCGEDRRGNLFCLSSRHAEEQIRWIEASCFKNYNFNFNDNNRYCSLNFAALNKFGSIEFRAMRGLDNREDVISWLDIIKEFCDYACYKMKNPANLLEEISVKTPLGFLKEVFSAENVKKLTAGIPENVINQSIYEGLRLIQMLCYRIGTEFDQVRLQGKDFWAGFQKDVIPEEEGRRVNPFAQPVPVGVVLNGNVINVPPRVELRQQGDMLRAPQWGVNEAGMFDVEVNALPEAPPPPPQENPVVGENWEQFRQRMVEQGMVEQRIAEQRIAEQNARVRARLERNEDAVPL